MAVRIERVEYLAGAVLARPDALGTLLTTATAILVAAPFGVAGALFISDIAPEWLREIVKPAIELLAGIPSIVYGFIGFTIINPYVGNLLSINPGALFAIGLVIGFMALPTVISVAEDALSAVPEPMKDGSIAMGATEWQTMKSVSIPTAFSGVSAAVPGDRAGDRRDHGCDGHDLAQPSVAPARTVQRLR